MKSIIFLAAWMLVMSVQAQSDILPMRERAQLINTILEDRLENLLPKLMRREGIDMWVLISREYNEDPGRLSIVLQYSLFN